MMEIGKSDNGSVSFDMAHLIETRLLLQASSGGGKSWAIRRLLEQSYGKVQQIVLDQEGEFSTLREKYEYIIAGKNADTTAHPSSARLLATRVLELGVSIICDLYELKAHERIAFVRYFLESVMAAPKKLWHPVLIVIDEAHHFAPEKANAESYAAVIDLCTRGRKRGYCAVLATQRLSKLHKDACAELKNKMIGQTTLDIDQQRAADELGLIGKEGRIGLRNLDPGQFHAFGPAFRIKRESFRGVNLLKVGGVISRHPQIGTAQIEAPPEPTSKMKAILAQIKDLPAQAEKVERDRQTLEVEIRDLKRQITTAQKTGPVPAPCNHGQTIKALEGRLGEVQRELDRANGKIENIKKVALSEMGRAFEKITACVEGYEFKRFEPIITNIKPATPPNAGIRRELPVAASGSDSGRPAPDISKSQQKILNALAALEGFGIHEPDKYTLAAHSGYRPQSGGYNNLLSSLRSAGLIDYPSPGAACLTDEGRRIARVDNAIGGIADLHDSWRGIIKSQSQRDILNHLLVIYPNDIGKTELAEAVGKQPGSGGHNNNLSSLRTLGALVYPKPGRVKAAEILFPEGLR